MSTKKKMIRPSVKLFEDQYNFYKDLKSKRLLIAFVEYMFEDIEPTDLKWVEKTAFNSLRKRMENSKKITDWNRKWWETSHWGWRKGKDSWELEWENKSKTSQWTSQEQVEQLKKNNEEEDNISKDILLEDEVREDWKRCYYWNVWLKDTELERLNKEYWSNVIEEYIIRLSEYIDKKWDSYTDHNKTIRKRLAKWNVKKKSERIEEWDKPHDFSKDNIIYPVRKRAWEIQK